jgi:hypothetical protein
LTVLSYLYKIFSRILFIISLIITIEIIVFSQSTFMEYAEAALPYILILTVLHCSTELILRKDKIYFRISEISMFLFVLNHKILAINLRGFILTAFLLYLGLSFKYREVLNPKAN